MYDDNGERRHESVPTWVAVLIAATVVGGLLFAVLKGWT